MDQKELWTTKLGEYENTEWSNWPSLFAVWAEENYFPRKSHILELGAGLGQDSRYFARKGHTVVSTDFSAYGVAWCQKRIHPSTAHDITVQTLDLTQTFPFDKATFDVVFAHLALHFFDTYTTRQIFREIHRVLGNRGILAALFNSTDDPEYATAEQLTGGVVKVESGMIKRFLTPGAVEDFAHRFELFALRPKRRIVQRLGEEGDGSDSFHRPQTAALAPPQFLEHPGTFFIVLSYRYNWLWVPSALKITISSASARSTEKRARQSPVTFILR